MSSVLLAGRELHQLEVASTVLLSPLDYEDLAAWRAAAGCALAELIGADVSGPTLLDALAMLAGVAGGDGARAEPSLHFVHGSERGPELDARGVALLGLLVPAFRAGAQIVRRLQGARDVVAALLDRCGEAVFLFDGQGRLLHATPAVAALLAAEPGRLAVEAEAQQLARRLTVRRRASPHREPAVPPASTTVRTPRGEYRLAASLLGERRPGLDVALGVTIAAVAPAPLDDAVLISRFRLTAREVAIARLLGGLRSTDAIAAQLGISWHTVRRHAEHIYRKLGVHSRAEIAERLQGRPVAAELPAQNSRARFG